MFNRLCYAARRKCGPLAGQLLVILLLGLTTLTPAQASVPAWQADLPQARLAGSGRMTFFGLTIYDARLWTVDGRWSMQQPFALELVYARTISREQLVNSSVEEMQRTGTPRAQAEAWAADMRRVFVDVKPGDSLIGVFLPERGARFYSRTGLVGEVADPQFARAFASIWLDERTRDPDLRRRLLGLER